MNHYFENELIDLKANSQFRELKNISGRLGPWITIEGKNYINLSSNDYLGLAASPELQKEFYSGLAKPDELSRYELSGSSSRLLTGNYQIYSDLEKQLADLYSKEAALVFNSGYHANSGLIPALFHKDDLILSDKLNHASIIDGIKLSQADFFRYNHLDYEHLEKILKSKRSKYKKTVIISESIFSMDGDRADLKKLTELRDNYQTLLYLDEAHACGVFGQNGLGLAEEDGVIQRTDILVGTFGKAFASIGAYGVFNRTLREYLINSMRPFIFTTALAPVNLHWTSFILKKLPQFKSRRESLLNLSSLLREKLQEKGLSTRGDSQIIPVMIGDNNCAVRTAEKLREHGFLLFPIRPPTVPKGTARIRISLMAALTWDRIKQMPELF